MKEEQKYNGSKTRNYFTAYLLASIRGKRLRYLEKQQKILFAEENLEDKEYTDADISPEERLELEQKEQLLMEEAQGIYPEWNEMAICADQLYNDKRMIVDNVWSIITIIVVCIVVFMGTVCNIVVLENYLNVKKIENEKNLQISEMSLQYDYYMKQSNDMENIRKISHDIKNHLEALRGNVDYQQKQEYIDGIESKLDIYQSYYKTGNA